MQNSIHNIITGEITVVDLTSEEIIQAEKLHQTFLDEQKERDALELAKNAVVAKLVELGLTTDDLKVLGLGTN